MLTVTRSVCCVSLFLKYIINVQVDEENLPSILVNVSKRVTCAKYKTCAILKRFYFSYVFCSKNIECTLQPRNWKVSKEVVHKLKFGDRAGMQNANINNCSRVTGILILIGILRC